MPPHFDLPGSSKAFLGLAVLESLFIVACAIVTIVTYYDDAKLSYYVLSGVVSISLLYFARSAVWNENTFELIAFLVASLAACGFALDKYIEADRRKTFYLVSLIVLGVFELIYFAAAYFVHKNFGYRLYKKLGSRPERHAMYKTYMIFMSLVKIDAFYNIFLVLLAGFFLLSSETTELVIDGVLVVVTLIWAFVLRYAVRHEVKYMWWTSAAFALVEPVYIAFKIADIAMHPDKYRRDDTTLNLGPFIAAGAVGLVIRGLLLTWMVLTYRNFGSHVHDKAVRLQRGPLIPHHHAEPGHAPSHGTYEPPAVAQE